MTRTATMRDSSSASRHGRYSDCLKAPGRVATLGADFRGDDRHGLAENPGRVLSPDPPFTIEFWWRLDTLSQSYSCAGMCRSDFNVGGDRTRGWNFYKMTTVQGDSGALAGELRRYSFWIGNGSTSDSQNSWTRLMGPEAVAGVWKHHAGVVTPTGATYYIDGSQVASASFTPRQIVADYSVVVGGFGHAVGGGGSPSGGGYGDMSEFAIFDHALSAARIAERYALAGGDEPAYVSHVLADGPLAYWRLNDPCGGGWRIGSIDIGVSTGL